MDMKKCDMCGKTAAPKWYGEIVYNPPDEDFAPCFKTKEGAFQPYWDNKKYDLCPVCMRKVLGVLRGREIYPSAAEREIEEKRKTEQAEPADPPTE